MVVAIVDSSGAIVVFCLSQVIVIGPFAVSGSQFDVPILNVRFELPVFLIYIVFVIDSPGDRLPNLWLIDLLCNCNLGIYPGLLKPLRLLVRMDFGLCQGLRRLWLLRLWRL